MFLVSLVNYQALLEQIHWFYIAAVASLMAVMIFGQKYLGARRWIKMPGGNHFQPSEWVKLILILAIAKYFADLRTSRALMARIHQGRSHRRHSYADGAGTARPRHRSHLHPDRHHGRFSWWHAVEAGPGRRFARRSPLARCSLSPGSTY